MKPMRAQWAMVGIFQAERLNERTGEWELVGEARNTIQDLGKQEALKYVSNNGGVAFGSTSILEIASVVDGAATVTVNGTDGGYPTVPVENPDSDVYLQWRWSDTAGIGFTPAQVRFKNTGGKYWSKAPVAFGAKAAGETWRWTYTLTFTPATPGAVVDYPRTSGLNAFLKAMSGQTAQEFWPANVYLTVIDDLGGSHAGGNAQSATVTANGVSGYQLAYLFHTGKGLVAGANWFTPKVYVHGGLTLLSDKDHFVNSSADTQIDYTYTFWLP